MKHIETSIGDLSQENIKFLIEKGVLTHVEGGIEIKHSIIHHDTLDRPLQIYSLFRLVYEDIVETLGVKDVDKIVNIMRLGSNNYKKVDSFFKSALPLVEKCYQKQSEGKNKKYTKKNNEDFEF